MFCGFFLFSFAVGVVVIITVLFCFATFVVAYIVYLYCIIIMIFIDHFLAYCIYAAYIRNISGSATLIRLRISLQYYIIYIDSAPKL